MRLRRLVGMGVTELAVRGRQQASMWLERATEWGTVRSRKPV